jgi:hypothetical protein
MPTTCGQGLAERAPLPAKLAELISALATNLQLHQRTLNVTDPTARRELDAYVLLERAYRGIAAELRAAAEQLAGYRDLPMATHAAARLADPALGKAFDAFANRERETLTLLQAMHDRDQIMLRAMRTPKKERSARRRP